MALFNNAISTISNFESSMNFSRIMTKNLQYAYEFIIPFPFEDGVVPSETELKQITEIIKSKPDMRIRYGDIVNTIPYDKRERNAGTLIWNGNCVCELQNEPDAYGCVPMSFEISEESQFHPTYYKGLIAHNNIWHPSTAIRLQCIQNIQRNQDGTLKILSDDQPVPYTTFNLHGIQYTVLFDANDKNIISEEKFIYTLKNKHYNYYYQPFYQYCDEIETETFCMVICTDDE